MANFSWNDLIVAPSLLLLGALLSHVSGSCPGNTHGAGESCVLLGMCPLCFPSPVSLLFQGLQPVCLNPKIKEVLEILAWAG